MSRQNLKSKNITQLLVSLLVIILVSYISSHAFFRIDLTSEKRYSLSDQSKNILNELNDIIYVEVYLEGDMPIGFMKLNKSVRELLDEFRAYGGRNIQYDFINPNDFTSEEDKQRFQRDLLKRGLSPTNLQEKDKEGRVSQKIIFPGAIINYGEYEISVNLLENNPALSAEVNLNNSIQSLEYKLISSIKRITTESFKRIAFIEGHGEFDQYQVMDITNELSKYYEVDRGRISGQTGILDNYSAIVIAQPLNKFPEEDKFVIDQYIMNGGRVMWLIDIVDIDADSLSTGKATLGLIRDLNLSDQLFKYGVRINPVLVKDIHCALVPVNVALAGEKAQFKPSPWWYFPLLIPPTNHAITKNLNMIRTEFVNALDSVGNDSDVRKNAILKSSQYSQVVNAPMMVSLEEINEKPKQQEYTHSFQTIGMLLEGKFNSVFKNRSISKYQTPDGFEFKDKSQETKMIVIADGDIIRNDVIWQGNQPQIIPLGYDRYSRQTYGNKDFIVNALNYLTDTDGLIQLRNREFKLRVLDKQRIINERLKWQLINTVLPVLMLIGIGILMQFLRKRKYTR